jgi:1-deoxy-D-xylulose-5-phosphate reductoisomerase
MVKYRDGSVIAQLGNPTMKLPIQYALTYPSRVVSTVKPLDLSEIGTLTFEKPDTERFPCLRLAYEAGRIGGTLPAAMNAANEAAVALFFKGKIGFSEISKTVEKAMASHKTIYTPTAEEILAVSNETYEKVFKDAAV